MSEQEHRKFLLEIANRIDELILDSRNIDRFQCQIRTFFDRDDAYWREIKLHQQNAEIDFRLRNREAGPPKEGWVWERLSSNKGYWRPPDTDLPPQVSGWYPSPGLSSLLVFDSKPAKIPTEDEKLMIDYVLLAVIHDGSLTDPTDKHIYFRLLDDPDFDDCDEWALLSWQDLSEWNNIQEYNYGNQIRARIIRALEHVKADLAKLKPAETEQKACSILKKIIGWIFKKTSHFIFAVVVAVIATIIAAIIVDILADFGWIERIKDLFAK